MVHSRRVTAGRGGIDNLVGAAIGNGCTGTEAGACAFGSAERTEAVAAFYAGGGFVSAAQYKAVLAACGGNWTSGACSAQMAALNAQVGPHNLYNMMDFCPDAPRMHLYALARKIFTAKSCAPSRISEYCPASALPVHRTTMKPTPLFALNSQKTLRNL